MGIVDLLEEVMDTTPNLKSIVSSPFFALAEQEPKHKVYIGQDFGGDRLRYWLIPGSEEKKFLVDWDYLLYLVDNLVSPLAILSTRAYSSVGKSLKSRIVINIDRIIGYMSEVIGLYDENAVDIQGQTLGVQNTTILRDARILKKMADDLKAELIKNPLPDYDIGAGASKLLGAYTTIIKPLYSAAYQRIVKK